MAKKRYKVEECNIGWVVLDTKTNKQVQGTANKFKSIVDMQCDILNNNEKK